MSIIFSIVEFVREILGKSQSVIPKRRPQESRIVHDPKIYSVYCHRGGNKLLQTTQTDESVTKNN